MAVNNFSFTFLGTGTSAGVPIIACDCDVCKSDDPRDKRLRCGACIRFTDKDGVNRVILIDTSPDLRQQVLREKLERCDAILFTHQHVDHTFGLDEVRRFNMVMKQAIDIYAEQETLGHLHRVFNHVFESNKNVNDSFVASLIPNEIRPEEPLNLFGLWITPIRLFHGRLPILGFIIHPKLDESPTPRPPTGERSGIGYLTDVSTIPPESMIQIGRLKTLILDMLRFRHHPTHLNLDQALQIALSVGAEKTFFIHMTHDISHAKIEQELPEGIHLAYDGLTL